VKERFDLMKPLGFGEVFEYSFRFYKENFAYLVKAVAFFYVPLLIFIGTFLIIFSDKALNIFSMMEGEFTDLDNIAQILKFTGVASLIGIVGGIIYLLATAASVKSIAVKLEGRDMGIKKVITITLSKIIPIIITSVIAGIALVISVFFCFFPMLILAVLFVFIAQVIMIEDKFYFKAIGRSCSLASNGFWPIVLINIVFGLIYLFASMVVSVPFYLIFMGEALFEGLAQGGYVSGMSALNRGGVLYNIVQTVLSNVLAIFFLPLINTALTVKFYNIRNIREGTGLIEAIEEATDREDI